MGDVGVRCDYAIGIALRICGKKNVSQIFYVVFRILSSPIGRYVESTMEASGELQTTTVR